LSALFSTMLALIVLFLVGYPLFKGSHGRSFPEARPLRRSLADDKEVIMSSLGEIEFDYHMRKLSEEDYQSLKHDYSHAAVEILKEQEEQSGKGKTKGKGLRVNAEEIEREIEAELSALNKKDKGLAKCHRCGTKLKEEKQQYCHSCGERQL